MEVINIACKAVLKSAGMYQNTMVLAHAVNGANFTCTASREKVVPFVNSVT